MGTALKMRRICNVALAIALALVYCLSTTQLAYPFHAWLESRASSHHGGHSDTSDHSVAEQAIYPCAIHKCQCKNALQCKTKCCCFPKASSSHSASHSASYSAAHGHGAQNADGDAIDKDRLTAAMTACGGMDDVDGLLPVPVVWLSLAPGILLPGAPLEEWTAPEFSAPPSPSLQAPFKVPISA